MLWLIALLLASPAQRLEPVGRWNVTTETDGCRMARSYGPDGAVLFGAETMLAGHETTLLIAAPKQALPEGTGEASVMLDEGRTISLHYGTFPMADSRKRLVRLFPDAESLGRIAASESVAIGTNGPALHVTNMPAALAALTTCTTDLLASWGVDPQFYVQGRMATLSGNPGVFFGPDSYPPEARRLGISGRVVLLLRTSPAGAVVGCDAVASADVRLNAQTCSLALAHVRVRPPTGADNRPIASYVVLPVRWTNP